MNKRDPGGRRSGRPRCLVEERGRGRAVRRVQVGVAGAWYRFGHR